MSNNVKIDWNKIVRVDSIVCFICGATTNNHPPKKQRLKHAVCPRCGGTEVAIISPDFGLPKGVNAAVTARG